MKWELLIKGFKEWLQIERSCSVNTILAYCRDISKFEHFCSDNWNGLLPDEVTLNHIKEFVKTLSSLEIEASSQSRIISGIRSFYHYLILEDIIENDPTELLELPKIGKKLPSVLSIIEIDKMIESIDLSNSLGVRNKAIIETLYGCGLRVTELTNLQLTNLFLEDGYLIIIGKGNKQRLVPIGPRVSKEIINYRDHVRIHLTIVSGNENILFLNHHGSKLTRAMIFEIVKRITLQAGIKKVVSPHTFRHTFATHLVENGADLRAVQAMLGHAYITTTEIYTHIDREYLRKNILKYHPLNQ